MKKKKIYLFFILVLMYAGLKAQPVMIYAENFDGSLSSLTRSPLNRWVLDSSFKSSSPHAMKGIIPSHVGDSVELITDWIDARLYSHLLFTFKHICKVSENDLVTIEYHIDKLGQTWKPIPTSSYGGSLAHYKGQRFSQKSYSEWKADDSLAQPASSWWKTETFDLSAEAGWERVRFKFKIKRGNILGTQFAYGWLIDDIQLYGANSQIRLPLVQFLSPLISDTVYSTGPYVVNAKVATRTTAPIIHPILRVSYTYNNISTYDSIVMTDQDGGDSLWTATIPQKLFGTYITYSINGKDTSGNELTISSNYYIKRAIGGASGEVIIGTATTNQPYAPFYR
ncbi:MAG: hypothetical protein PHQ82_09045, partial [Bacteroidales bacterium]|nr:hypothetical protein [Bacteroidales bacterium]